MATITEQSHVARFGRSKAVIWLKSFIGETPWGIRKNGYKTLQELGKYYSQKYGITLTLNRIFSDIEWTLTDKPASAEMSEQCDIKPQREIADALFKFDDATHPHTIEINQAPTKPPEIPSQHADTLYYLLMHAPNLLKQLTESVLVINTKLEVLEKRVK
jgi:hypothetical protein